MFDTIIRIVGQLLIFSIILDVILSYLTPPENPIRRFMDQLVQPMLKPIQKLLPQNTMIDISPILLIIFIEIVQMVLVGLF